MADERKELGETGLIDVGDVDPTLLDDVTEPPTERQRISPKSFHAGDERPAVSESALIGDRFAAFLVDLMFLYAFYWPLLIAYRSIAFGKSEGPVPVSGIEGLIFHGIFIFLVMLWFVLTEMAFQASPGKYLCKLAIRKKDGNLPSFFSVFIRNIMIPVDILLAPFCILSGLLEWTKHGQRLGDVFAGTVVIKRSSDTPKQYALSLDIISTATARALAFIIDLCLVFSFVGGYLLFLSPDKPIASMLLVVYCPVFLFLFYAVPEWLFKTSPGKWILGMVICQEDGTALELPSAVIRSAWRIFDSNPFGFLTMLFSIRHQRPGDTAAQTVIINSKRELKGLIGTAIMFLIAIGTIYGGIGNRDSFLHPDFKINFLPSIDLTGLEMSKAEKPKNLAIQNFSFGDAEKKQPRAPSIYAPGETVFINFNVIGFSEKDDKVWLVEDISINYPDGSVGLVLENLNEFQQELSGQQTSISFENTLALPADALPGRYSLTITLHDKISARDLKEQRFFYVSPKEEEQEETEPPVMENLPRRTTEPPPPTPEQEDTEDVPAPPPLKPFDTGDRSQTLDS